MLARTFRIWCERARPPASVTPLLGSGPLLGQDAAARFPHERVPLAAGDKLVLYTDGLVEAGPSSGKVYGSRRLHSELERLAHEKADGVAPRLLEAIHQFAGNADPSDDMTIVVIEWPASVAES
jgi:serine phosphatase RsbU (regulator of sigma subunit)